jgi:hypothetical protein
MTHGSRRVCRHKAIGQAKAGSGGEGFTRREGRQMAAGRGRGGLLLCHDRLALLLRELHLELGRVRRALLEHHLRLDPFLLQRAR